jgi:hypothetical protein
MLVLRDSQQAFNGVKQKPYTISENAEPLRPHSAAGPANF